MIKKANLPKKTCPVCNKPFTWRKKWRLNWDKVKYCSKRCSSKWLVGALSRPKNLGCNPIFYVIKIYLTSFQIITVWTERISSRCLVTRQYRHYLSKEFKESFVISLNFLPTNLIFKWVNIFYEIAAYFLFIKNKHQLNDKKS